MIRCVAVRNDVRLDGSGFGALLDPGLPGDHVFRCDQLLFFREGVAGSKNYAIGAGANNQGRSAAQRIYYGHSYQLADASLPPNGQTYYDLRVTDGGEPFALIPPWADSSTLSSVLTYWSFDANSPDLGPIQTQGRSPPPTIPANSWLMSRQAVLMADDADTGSPYRFSTARLIPLALLERRSPGLSIHFCYRPRLLRYIYAHSVLFWNL